MNYELRFLLYHLQGKLIELMIPFSQFFNFILKKSKHFRTQQHSCYWSDLDFAKTTTRKLAYSNITLVALMLFFFNYFSFHLFLFSQFLHFNFFWFSHFLKFFIILFYYFIYRIFIFLSLVFINFRFLIFYYSFYFEFFFIFALLFHYYYFL